MIYEILLSIIIFLLVSFAVAFFLISRKFYKIIINFLPSTVFSSSNNTTGERTIISNWKYKFMLLKAYFDNGYSLTSYPKWAFAVLGIGSAIKGYSLWYLISGAAAYGILCFFIGWIFISMGFFEAQNEVNNQFNLFVKELRERKTI